MSNYSATVTFGSLTMEIRKMNAQRINGVRTQVVGRNVQIKNIPDSDSFIWRLDITDGIMSTSTRDADRTTLEGFQDGSSRTFADGIHDGEYYIQQGSLVFEDDETTPGYYQYKMTLIQKRE